MSDELIRRLKAPGWIYRDFSGKKWVDDAPMMAAAALTEAHAEIARLRSIIGRYGLQVGDAEGVDFTVGKHLTPAESVEVSNLIDAADILRVAALSPGKGE
jgi:hypothetical protein